MNKQTQLEMFPTEDKFVPIPQETIEERVARLECMVIALQAQVQDLAYLVTNQACRSPIYWRGPLPFYVGSEAGGAETVGFNIENNC